MAMVNIKSCFNNDSAFFSPITIGRLPCPTSLSPCISRISKKAVRTKAKTEAKKVMKSMPVVNCTLLERWGIAAVTIPQAMAINTVFEPGISLMLWIFFPGFNQFGKSLTLYRRPKILMILSSANGMAPRRKAIKRPVAPDKTASVIRIP